MMEENQNPGYEALETMNIEQKRIPDDVAEILIKELIRHKLEGKQFRHNPELVPRIKQYVLGDQHSVHFNELKAKADQTV